jgi:DNA damage-binding protein 1
MSFLYLSSNNRLNLQIRCLNASSRSFTDITKPVDVLSPLRHLNPDDDTDFPDIAFSCPAARRVLPLPASTGHDRALLVMGDEYTVMYSLGLAGPAMGSPKNRRLSTTSSGVNTSSPRAANTRRSPQAEIFGPGKKRKSSVSKAGEERWEIKPIWRVRQGFGTVLAYV